MSRDLADSFYGRCAGVYDTVATAPVVGGWRARCVADLDLSPGDTVVDMGCGTGGNLPVLREQVGPEGTVIGIDLVDAMLRRARARIEHNGWENVHAVRADATRPPVAGVDALTSTFVVGMFGNPGEVVESWLRCVRPGGRVTLMSAVRSDRRLGLPLNLAFRAFTRLTAPGHRLRRRSPTRDLEARWARSVDALVEGTVDHTVERLGLGFVALAGGRVPG